MKIHYTSLLVLSLVFIIAFGLLAALLTNEIVISVDRQIMQSIQVIESPYLTFVMKFFSFIGNTIQVIIISFIVLFLLYKIFHKRQELILYVIVLIGSAVFNVLLKSYFQRERPTLYEMVIEKGYSFPSGHSMAALSLWDHYFFVVETYSQCRWSYNPDFN